MPTVESGNAKLRHAPVQANQPSIHFRDDVRPTDRAAVRSLVVGTGFFRPDEVDVAVELIDERLAKGVASGYQFVFAEIDSVLAGYACFGPIACTTASFDLYWIAVEPSYQRLGIGRSLVNEVERQIAAAGGGRIYIDTSGKEQYAPTRAFYERNGFHCDARLKDFYAPCDDRVIYVKEIRR
jgi:GNAT superfamily N-acetyltransferase